MHHSLICLKHTGVHKHLPCILVRFASCRSKTQRMTHVIDTQLTLHGTLLHSECKEVGTKELTVSPATGLEGSQVWRAWGQRVPTADTQRHRTENQSKLHMYAIQSDTNRNITTTNIPNYKTIKKIQPLKLCQNLPFLFLASPWFPSGSSFGGATKSAVCGLGT